MKGTRLAKDKVDGFLKPIMAPNVTSTCKSSCDSDALCSDDMQNVMTDGGNT